jgi:hypothetical protein
MARPLLFHGGSGLDPAQSTKSLREGYPYVGERPQMRNQTRRNDTKPDERRRFAHIARPWRARVLTRAVGKPKPKKKTPYK